MLSIHDLVTVLIVLLAGVIVAEPLARLLRLPYVSVLILLGFLGSELVVALGGDTGLRAGSFHDLVFYVFLPVLVFEAAFAIEQDLLLRNLGLILLLAVGVMLGTTLLAGALLYYGIGHPTGFPWVAALLTGAIVAATDPAAVIGQLRSMGAPENLSMLLEGESLFNDATAVVLFGVLLSLATMPDGGITAGGAVSEFFSVFFGGLLCGAASAAGAAVLGRFTREEAGRIVVTLLAAYGSFFLAESVFGVSGVMSVLLCGLLLARLMDRQAAGRQPSLASFWQVSGHVTTALVFLLMGVTITVNMFTERWLAMLIAVAAVVLARVACLVPALRFAPGTTARQLTPAMRWFMAWGGLRGAITLALALSLPTDLDYWWTVQSIAFGVVLFTLLVQAPLTPLVMRQLGLRGRG